RSRLSGRPSWRTSSVRSSGLGPNWSPSSLVARNPGAKNGKSDMSSYLRDTTLATTITCNHARERGACVVGGALRSTWRG
ncbi:MAG: hypothetical protein NUV74_00890, partial [Candidatus Brocadiaceae bacterium]|nr:hypothetical protein [Candidatus Brocadiaceae bacterium]